MGSQANEALAALAQHRTSAALLVRVGGHGLQVRVRDQEFAIGARGLELLNIFAQAADARSSALQAFIEEYTVETTQASVRRLVELGCLEEESPNSPNSGQDEHWSTFMGAAGNAFHHDSRDHHYIDDPEDLAAFVRNVQQQPRPAAYKCSCERSAEPIALPVSGLIEAQGLSEIMFARRTSRNFAAEAMPIETLATLLFHAAGVAFELETEHFGRVLFKAAPSPGARHGTEIYCYPTCVQGLEPGAYHYCSMHHRLNATGGKSDDFIGQALANQAYFESASVLFVLTYATRRVSWKYRMPRSYRLIHFEVGHVCQNLLLAGTALGLGVFQTGAFNDSEVEKVLDLQDGEFAMYVAGAGIEAPARHSPVALTRSAGVPTGLKPKRFQIFEGM